MKRIFTTLKDKWPEYLLEIIVLVVGIYGAFALDRWNDNRLESIEEKEILTRVKADLQNTIDEFRFLNSIRDQVLNGTRGIYQIAQTRQYTNTEVDSLLGLTMYRPTFNNKMGAIDLLFSSGKINLIKSDSIKARLITWPGSIDDMIEEEVYALKVMQDQYYPTLAKYVFIQDILNFGSGTSFFGTIIEEEAFIKLDFENDYEGLFNDAELLNHMRMRASHMQITNSETNLLIKQTEELIAMIDEELTP